MIIAAVFIERGLEKIFYDIPENYCCNLMSGGMAIALILMNMQKGRVQHWAGTSSYSAPT